MEARHKLKMKRRHPGRRGQLALLAVILLGFFVLQACQNRPDESTDLRTSLTSITISPANPSLADPTTQQMTATGIYANGSTADITSSVNWVSEFPAIATISDTPNDSSNPKGQLKTVITGSTTITARSGTVTGTTTVSVTSAQLQTVEVTPAYSTFATVCTPWVQMKATGIFDDGTVLDLTDFAIWSSSNTSAATISNASTSRGKLTVVAAGTATITASYNSISGNTGITLDGAATLDATAPVGPRVTPFNPKLSVSSNQQLKATVILNNGTAQDVTAHTVWSSSNTAEATVSNAEESLGLGRMGSSTATPSLTADLGGNTGRNSTLSLDSTYYLYRLEINPEFPGIAQGIPYQLTAIGIFKDTGNSYFFAQDLTDQVTWSSSNTSLVTISNTAGSKGLASLTKTPGVADRTVTISAKSPLLTSLTGSTTLTVKSNSLKLTSIAVSPTNPKNHLYTTQQFKAYGTFSDGTNSFVQDITSAVIWSSSDTAIAVISNEYDSAGKAVNRTDGQTTLKATRSGVSGSSVLTVKPSSVTVTSLDVTPATASAYVRIGTKLKMTATATFSDGDTQDVTENVMWESADETLSRVSNVAGEKGIVTGIAAGGPNIIADWRGTTTSTPQAPTVQAVTTLDSVTITEAASAGVDGTIQLTATGYDGGTNGQDITETGIWSSSRPEVASVLNIPGKKGKLIRNGNGTTTITFRLTNETPAVDISDTHEITVDQ